MRCLAVFFTLIFGAMGFAETYEQEWGQTAAPNPAWSPTAAGSCKKIGLTVIPGMYYDGQFFEKAVQAKGLSATCFDSYGNTVWVDLWCKITKDDGTISRYRGYCHGPANYCGANEKGNPIDVYSRIKRETSVDWTSTKDARFSIERSYLSNGELSLGTNSNYNRLGHAGVWRSSFNEIVRYTRSIKKHVFYRKDGSRIYFNKDYTPIHPQNKIDFKFTDYDWTGPWTLLGTDKSGLTRIFDSRDPWDRYLKGLKWPDGYQINIDRAHGKILAIRDNRGQRAEFTWQNDTVLGSTREVITKIEIDADYEGTFSPDVRIDYAYEPNTRQETVPILAEVTRTDISSGNSELAYRYTYHKEANDKPYYPLLLAEVYDGRLDAQGDPTLYAQFEYNIDGTTVDGGPNQSSNSNIFTVNTPFGYTIRPAISTTHVGAETYQVQGDFDDPNAPSRKVINPLGHVTEYDFAKSADRLLTSSEKGLATPHCLGTTLSREFTPNTGAPEGFVYAQVERNGSRTTFERDSIGRILVKTEDADGVDPQVTTYTWAGETHRPATRTTAQMTEAFSYTPTGLLTQYSQTDALTGSPDHGKTRTWDYSYVTYSSGLTVLRSVDGPGLVADGVYDVTTYHYDSKGNLTKLIDPNKLETEIVARDALGQPALVRDPYGVKWAFSYDINGRITSVTRNPGVAGSNTSAYAYDPVGQLTSYTNFNGDTWSFEYDQARRMSRTVNPSGDAVSYRHDAMGNVTRVEYSDGTSAATFWEDTEFDKLGRLLKTIGAEGQAWQYRHDVENNMDMVTDPTSLATNHSFDALNRLVGVVDRAGYTSLNEHDHANQLTKFTDQRSIDTTFTYNGFGEVLSEASADRGSLFYTYNNRGLVASMTDARGVVSNYEYDDGGRLTGRSFPSDPTQDQSFSYALGEGALSSSLGVTSINGQAISSGASITLASGADVELLTDGSLRYSQNGMFGALDDGQTATDSFVYSVTNTWGATEDSNISVSVDGVTYPTPDRALSLAATPFVDIGDVNLAGEFTVESWVKFPAGTTINYDDTLVSDGTVNQTLNFHKGRFRFWSEKADRLIASTLSTHDTWTHYAITRDAAGILRIYINGVLDVSGSIPYMYPFSIGTIGRPTNSTTAKFDNLRIWSVERSEAELLSNMNGHVPVNSPGLERYYSFDNLNGVVVDGTGNSPNASIAANTRLTLSDSPVSESMPVVVPLQNATLSIVEGIDANFHVLDEHLNLPGSGRTDITSDASGKSYINYDSITGFPVEDFRKIEQHDYSVRYTYDADGQITSTIYPSGQAVAYVRDADGRITKITVDRGAGPVSVISGVTYLPNGPVASMTYGDGILHSASYDNSYRLTGLTDGQGASLLRDATYTWTVRDNLASVSDPINPMRNATYGYSPREFLASATGGWDTLAFTYDGVGNRLTRAATQSGTTSTDTYSYPSSSNRLQSIAGTAPRSFTYDAAGNTTYDNRQGGGYGYTYDAAGRMESFSINGVVQAEYVYNALGQQVIRRLPQDQTAFHNLFDLTGNRIAEYEVDPLTNAKTLAREYIWMDSIPVAVVENGQLYFVRTDHIGRPVFATNSAGVKMWDAAYLPFGGVHTTTGDPINLRFPGQWFQSESGLHQNWMRDYDPTTGRYIQADPLGLVDGASVYGYALQNPGRYVDLRGEQATSSSSSSVMCAFFGIGCRAPSCSAGGASFDPSKPDRILPPIVTDNTCENCGPPEEDDCAEHYVKCVSSSLGGIWDQEHGMSRCGKCNSICFAEGYWPDQTKGGKSCNYPGRR